MDSMQHSMLTKCTYPKTAPSSLLKAPQQLTIQRRSPAKKKDNKKTTFSRKYFPILLNQMER